MKTDLKKGDRVKAINVGLLKGNDVAPPLKLNEVYVVNDVITTAGDHDHIDVGLKSRYNYVRCHATTEEIPDGDTIHWCHPSRFERV